MKPRMLDGWKAIADVLTEAADVTISVAQAKRYARRRHDPLPARRIGRSVRPRIAASLDAVVDWSFREFGSG